jgi:hypothetical protein
VWGVWQSWPPTLYVLSDSAFIGVRDPNFFSNAGLKYGYVRHTDLGELPIIGSLRKYDVKEGDVLWMTLGRSAKTVSGTVKSLCYDWVNPDVLDFLEKGFVSVASCHVALDITVPLEKGDSGSPVYALEGRRGNVFVRAYGVVSAREGLCIPGTDYCIISRAIVAPIDWRNVKVS